MRDDGIGSDKGVAEGDGWTEKEEDGCEEGSTGVAGGVILTGCDCAGTALGTISSMLPTCLTRLFVDCSTGSGGGGVEMFVL